MEPLAYSRRDAATLMGVSLGTVLRLLSTGALPARKIGARVIILREDIIKCLAGTPQAKYVNYYLDPEFVAKRKATSHKLYERKKLNDPEFLTTVAKKAANITLPK